ncbi:putative methyltransferase DDB_G0268948 [Babylonia areolata]|uniref:putative methyltransferase DDB_G0268948 n=1 Tax=Babylonia areolata TaxID=304850 RepID=UPI003FD24B4F
MHTKRPSMLTNLEKFRRLLHFSVGFVRTMSERPTLFQSSDIADYYLKYRPTYSRDVFDTIVNFCKEKESASFSLALDVGCGSGQSTLPLTKHFQKVIGIDVSDAQISKAPTQISNVSFRVGPAEDLSFVDSGTVDLVTVAQALHWLDYQRLYEEAQRVLKPCGALVVYGYGMPTLSEAKSQEVIDYFYTEILGPYWTDGRNHVEEHYQSFSLPFNGWRRNDSLKIEREWTLDELIGYFCSWSAYQKFLFSNPMDGTMGAMRQKLQETLGLDGLSMASCERTVKVTWPVFMLMGHKPQD